MMGMEMFKVFLSSFFFFLALLLMVARSRAFKKVDAYCINIVGMFV